MRRHPRRASVDPTRPRAWGTDDRSGFVGNHEDMIWQYDWRGTQLVSKRILVYPDMLDVPQRQLGTIFLPPDPVSITNARPERYAIDEQTYRITMDGTQRYQMDGTARLESNLQGNPNAGYTPS